MAGKDYGTLDTIGIVSSRRLAETVMDNIQTKYMSETQKYMKSKHNIELYLKDGTRFIVCPMSEASKGRRLTYALIDKNIHDTEFLNNIVHPMCAYCKEDEIFYIADSKDATKVAFDIIDLIRESKYIK